ncbi:MAG: RsmB/NOP family class I SAM-dependent RNA methyltransferase [Pseudomonadota bacterium]
MVRQAGAPVNRVVAMRADARVAAAIQVLAQWLDRAGPAERLMTAWGRANRYAGSGDRRAIADMVYLAIRRRSSALWVAGGDMSALPARRLMMGALRLDGADVDALFTGAEHAPEPLSKAERAEIRTLEEAPRAVRLDLSEWVLEHLEGVASDALAQLSQRAPLDLRVNRLKASRDAALAALIEADIHAAPLAEDPDALRVREGAYRMRQARAYREGLVEIQDCSSQRVARFANAVPGETVLDFCAGGGGKALALAAQMGGQGRVIAHDSAPQRLAQIPERAARAGAEIEIAENLDHLTGLCDLVFVDAPCSGSGAWRRNPEEKWRLTPDDLIRLTALQGQILEEAAGYTRPGGRLIYATCSLFRMENEARVAAFVAARPDFIAEETLRLQTLSEGDGFFACRLIRCSQE